MPTNNNAASKVTDVIFYDCCRKRTCGTSPKGANFNIPRRCEALPGVNYLLNREARLMRPCKRTAFRKAYTWLLVIIQLLDLFFAICTYFQGGVGSLNWRLHCKIISD